MVIPGPRRETSLTSKQERFVIELLIDDDRRRAVRDAGYEVADDAAADSCASRLMRNDKVKAFYYDKKAEYFADRKRKAEDWYNYLWMVAIEAIEERDWTGAVSALREIGRHLGVYDLDNNQRKNLTPADVEAMKAKLVTLGMNYTRANFPPHLLDQVNRPKDGES